MRCWSPDHTIRVCPAALWRSFLFIPSNAYKLLLISAVCSDSFPTSPPAGLVHTCFACLHEQKHLEGLSAGICLLGSITGQSLCCGYHRFTVLPGQRLGCSLWKPCRAESIDRKAPEAQAWQYISASRSLERTGEQSRSSTGTCSTAEPAQHCAQREASSCAPGPGLTGAEQER